MGYCLKKGKGVAQNLSEAVNYYKRSADQGYAVAQYQYGFCLENGIEVAMNFGLAAEYYRRAADQDYAVAQHRYGCCLENGIGVAKNFDLAITYYMQAAKQGDENARERLRVLGCIDIKPRRTPLLESNFDPQPEESTKDEANHDDALSEILDAAIRDCLTIVDS
jgi:TPR repeat protein